MEGTDTEDDATLGDELSDPSVPDGGWGWVVALACLTINVIYDGCSYSFGILFVNLLDDFGDTKRNTALIGSLFFSVPLLLGPFASVAVNKFGYRKGTMVGGLMAAVGIALSSLANSTGMLCLTYGILAGMGMSIPYLTSSVAVTKYFKKRLALASGICESGAGVGTVVFAPFTQWLISTYGWRGALLIVSGVVANIAVCGALIFPTKPYTREVSIGVLNTSNDNNADVLDDETIEMLPKYSHEPTEKRTDDTNDDVFQNGNNESVDLVLVCSSDKKPELIQIVHDSIERKGRFYRMSNSVRKYFTRIQALACWPFAMFTASSFIMYFWYDVPYIFTVDRAIDLGIEPANAAVLLLVIGIVHAPGNLIYGFIGDKPWINRTLLYGLSLVLCGVCMLTVPYCFPYWSMALTAAGFGLFTSAQETLTSAILTDICDQKVNDAFGMIMFLEGIANLIGPYVAGLLCDETGAFDATFIISGVSVAFGGGLCAAYTCFRPFNETRLKAPKKAEI